MFIVNFEHLHQNNVVFSFFTLESFSWLESETYSESGQTSQIEYFARKHLTQKNSILDVWLDFECVSRDPSREHGVKIVLCHVSMCGVAGIAKYFKEIILEKLSLETEL